MAEFRARVAALSFRNPFVKVTEFHAHTGSTTSFESATSTKSAPFERVKSQLGQAFTYRKASSAGSSATFNTATANHYTMHQAQGLFPRINHYYGDQDRYKFWKGFAVGSFSSWAAAWYLRDQPTEKEKAA